jgi:hypothetical protein
MINTDAGYAFSEHFSASIGLPLIITRSPFSPVVNRDYNWTGLLGEPYVDVRYKSTYHGLNYTSILTGTVPVNNLDRIYTTGRFGVDWFNHIDKPVGDITPFLNVGASNGAVNRFIMPRPYSEARPYQTLGFLADVEGGAEYSRNRGSTRGLGIGASAYALLPAGPQKVYSRLVIPFSALGGDGQHMRYWQSKFETVGTSKIARDNGFSAWLDVKRSRVVGLQLGYTHSVHYKLDFYTVVLTFDTGSLLRAIAR